MINPRSINTRLVRKAEFRPSGIATADGKRRGVLVIEVVVAAIVLGAAIAMLVPGMTAVRHQRQSYRFESLAMLELNNVSEFLSGEISPERQPLLSAWFQRRYPGAQLNAEELPGSQDERGAGLRSIRLTIHRTVSPSLPDQKVSLVVWKHVQEAAQ